MSEHDFPKTDACFFCEMQVVIDEYLCHGCGEIICDDCAKRDPGGNHDPEDHRPATG